jgi:hypothetical protein
MAALGHIQLQERLGNVVLTENVAAQNKTRVGLEKKGSEKYWEDREQSATMNTV